MAKQRVVNTRFWDDDYVMELDPYAKLLFLYFITNPLTDLCGAYQITLKRMAFDTGIKVTKIQEILERFEADGKIIHRDGWLLVRNFGKHQQGNSPNVKKGTERSLNACPDWIKQTLSNPSYTPSIENALLPIGITYRDNLTEQPLRNAGKAENPKRNKPVSLPTSVESEINIWLDAVAPLTGAKDRQTMANPKRWREAVEKAVKEGHDLGDFLTAVQSEAKRNKGTPQYFTPEGSLKSLQMRQIKTNNGFAH